MFDCDLCNFYLISLFLKRYESANNQYKGTNQIKSQLLSELTEMGKLIWVIVLVCAVTVIALGLGLGLGLGLNSGDADVDQDYLNSVTDGERIDCFPDDVEKSAEACEERGCFWKEPVEDLAPWCFHPPSHGYDLVSEPENTLLGWRASLKLKERPERYLRDIQNLKLDVEMQTTSRLRLKVSLLKDTIIT